ncbi:MAG: hypothetical protein ACI8ZM_002525 [Crocinitomix sp.]|jgi:hypothetical protein
MTTPTKVVSVNEKLLTDRILLITDFSITHLLGINLLQELIYCELLRIPKSNNSILLSNELFLNRGNKFFLDRQCLQMQDNGLLFR